MKNLIKITTVFTALMLLGNLSVHAQQSIGKKHHQTHPNTRPSRNVINRPAFKPVHVLYDDFSTVLTVRFTKNSCIGTVEVFRNGTKIAGITASSGTTFSCRLKDYGTGNYSIVVSQGNTVVYNKNITVK